MTFNYNNLVPATNNNPSADQPEMLINTQSINSIIAVDHIGFNAASGGKHKFERILSLETQGISLPAGVAGEGTVYTKTASAVTNLWYRPDATTDEYQLTRTISASKTLFGTNTNYSGTLNGGWSFLPGGMLFQYGLAPVAASGTPTTITFPVAFTGTPFSITIGSVTGEGNSPGSNNQFVKDGSVSNTQFQIVNSSSSSARKVYWMAVGV